MLDQDAVVGGCVLPRKDPLSRLTLEGKVLPASGSHPVLRDALSEAALEGRSWQCGIPPAQGVPRVAGKEGPCEEDPSCGHGTRGPHPAWEVIPCCHQGGVRTLPGYSGTPGGLLGGIPSQKRT